MFVLPGQHEFYSEPFFWLFILSMAHWEGHKRGGEGERPGKYLYIHSLYHEAACSVIYLPPNSYGTLFSDLSLWKLSFWPPTSWKWMPGLLSINLKIPRPPRYRFYGIHRGHSLSVWSSYDSMVTCLFQSITQNWFLYKGNCKRTFCKRSCSVEEISLEKGFPC